MIHLKNNSDQKTSPNKNSMIIRVLVILLLGYLAYDQILIFLKKNEEAPKVTIIKKLPKKKIVVVAPPEVAPPPPPPPPPEAQPQTLPQPQTQPTEEVTSAPVENINLVEKTATTNEAPSPAPEESARAMSSTPIKVEEELKKIMETPPPNYESSGRGLVYDCVSKHWVCLDKQNYKQCFQNDEWNKSQNKKPECVIQNVYEKTEDCQVIQKYNIEQATPTDFCQNTSANTIK